MFFFSLSLCQIFYFSKVQYLRGFKEGGREGWVGMGWEEREGGMKERERNRGKRERKKRAGCGKEERKGRR